MTNSKLPPKSKLPPETKPPPETKGNLPDMLADQEADNKAVNDQQQTAAKNWEAPYDQCIEKSVRYKKTPRKLAAPLANLSKRTRGQLKRVLRKQVVAVSNRVEKAKTDSTVKNDPYLLPEDIPEVIRLIEEEDEAEAEALEQRHAKKQKLGTSETSDEDSPSAREELEQMREKFKAQSKELKAKSKQLEEMHRVLAEKDDDKRRDMMARVLRGDLTTSREELQQLSEKSEARCREVEESARKALAEKEEEMRRALAKKDRRIARRDEIIDEFGDAARSSHGDRNYWQSAYFRSKAREERLHEKLSDRDEKISERDAQVERLQNDYAEADRWKQYYFTAHMTDFPEKARFWTQVKKAEFRTAEVVVDAMHREIALQVSESRFNRDKYTLEQKGYLNSHQSRDIDELLEQGRSAPNFWLTDAAAIPDAVKSAKARVEAERTSCKKEVGLLEKEIAVMQKELTKMAKELYAKSNLPFALHTALRKIDDLLRAHKTVFPNHLVGGSFETLQGRMERLYRTWLEMENEVNGIFHEDYGVLKRDMKEVDWDRLMHSLKTKSGEETRTFREAYPEHAHAVDVTETRKRKRS